MSLALMTLFAVCFFSLPNIPCVFLFYTPILPGNYSALIEHMDEGIGKVVAALKEKGMYENTLIVFASDNGGVEVNEQI